MSQFGLKRICSKFDQNLFEIRSKFEKNTLKALVLEHIWLFNDCLKYEKFANQKKTHFFTFSQNEFL